MVREAILNLTMFALLTFPSYEFDLKNIAASVVPTLVDPKRRVRQVNIEHTSDNSISLVKQCNIYDKYQFTKKV